MLYVVDTSMFSSEDFVLFLESSEYIQKVESERRQSRRQNVKPRKTREEDFEISAMNENDILKIMCNDSDRKENSLSASIEDLFQYFSEDVNVENEGAPTRTVDREFHRPIIVDACPKKYATVKYEPEYIRRARIRNETGQHRKNDSGNSRPKSMPVPIIDSNIFDRKTNLTPVTQFKQESRKLSEEDAINLSVKEKISLFNKFLKNDTQCNSQKLPEKLKTPIQTKKNFENVKTEPIRLESETFYSQSVRERIKIFEQESLKNDSKKDEKSHSIRKNLSPEQQCRLKKIKINKNEQYFYKCEKSKEYDSGKGYSLSSDSTNMRNLKNSCSTPVSMSEFTVSTERVSSGSGFNCHECSSSTLKVSKFNVETTKIQKNLTNVALTIQSIREQGLFEGRKNRSGHYISLNSAGPSHNGFIQETRLDVKLTQTLPKTSNRKKLIRVSSVQSSKLLELRTENECFRTTSSCAGIGRRAALKKDPLNTWSNRANAMIKIN